MAKLVINASPILVPDQELKLYHSPYRDEDHFKGLRDELRDYYKVRRFADEIQCVSISPKAVELSWKSRTVQAHKEPHLIASLVMEALLRYAYMKGTPSRKYSPVTIPGGKNLVLGLPNGDRVPSWLQVRSRFTFETRTLRSDKGNIAPFLIVDSNTSREITAPIAELASLGFVPDGKYVLLHTPNSDPRLAKRYELAGRVENLHDSVLHLSDTRTETTQVDANDAFLEPRDEYFEELLHLILGRASKQTLDALDKKLSEVRQADTKLAQLKRIVDGLVALRGAFEIADGISVKFGEFIAQGDDYFPLPESAPPTRYIFDVGRAKVDENNRRGMDAYGPYNWSNFTPMEPKIAVICDAMVKGVVESFLTKLTKGITIPNSSISPYRDGFTSLFRLRRIFFNIFETKDNSPSEVRSKCKEIADRGQAGGGFDLVLLQNSETTKRLKGNDNPYLVAKSLLLRAGIASQSFFIEKTNSRDYDLAYIVADLALAIYAKLGGTPWLISADHAIEHEIILGIGSASLGDSRLGGRERIVGITSVFKGDGDYLLSNLTKAVSISEYEEELTTSLRVCIDQVRNDMNWKEGDAVRIVVHAFKPMNNREIDAVQRVVNELRDYTIQFAFIHVKETHPYSVFDLSEGGKPDRATGFMRGKYCPKRGTFLRISRDQTIACTWGAKDVRNAEHGYPKPILIELHGRSTFTDHTYLARQVLNFASHSWRSFGAARMPVTILYSELVADMLGRLKEVDGWTAEVLPTSIGKRRWFL